jgi:hypothetical protein
MGKQRCPIGHQLGDRFAVANPFQDCGSQIGHSFGMVQLETTLHAIGGELPGSVDQQFFLLSRGEMHKSPLME